MKINILLFLLITVATSFSLKAQDKIEITGTIKDGQTQEPLPGVSISVVDLPGLGAISDKNGAYKINVERYRELLFTFLGYDSVKVRIDQQRQVDVSMNLASARAIDEVVITSTGAQKRMTVTGAVTTVNLDDLKHSSPSVSVANSLAGNVAGVLAQLHSGAPGKDFSEFWIRGISTFGASTGAYVLVDGFERDLNEVNIEDIESFSVLKDASATAIYGSKGANGVVLITTKHGKSGKIHIDGKVESSYNTRTITPKIADGKIYASLLNEARITRNHEPIYSPVELDILDKGLDPDLYPNVDWMNQLLKDGAMTYRANLNMSGGGPTARYFVSGSYLDEQGMYRTDEALKNQYNTNADYERWNYRLNTDVNVTPTTIVKLGVAGSLAKRNSPGLGDDDVWGELYGYSPIRTPILYSDGKIPAVGTGNKTNPWVASTQTGFNENWDNNIQTNITLDQNFDFLLKGLHFIGRFGYDTYNSSHIERRKWPEQWVSERARDRDGNLVFRKISDPSDMHQTSGSDGSRREFLDLMLNYDGQAKKHYYGFVAKYTQDAFIQTQNLGEDIKNGVPRKNQGFAGQVKYNYDLKYFVDFNFGYTGSENFARGHQFGFFPAFSGAWNLGEEKLIKDGFAWINMFKVRFSYGKVGNDNLGGSRFPYLYTIDGGLGGYQWADFSDDRAFVGRGFTQVASPLVTWEVATKKDLGVDLSLFNDRFSLMVDYFSERRDGIFMSRNFMPGIVGLESVPSANVGAVSSEGIDGNFRYTRRFGDVSLTLRGNFTYSKNIVLDKDEGNTVYPYQKEEGYRVGQTKGLIALGLFEDYKEIRNSPQQMFGDYQPGDIKYKDVNGDGVIDDGDQVAVGATNRPNLVYGLGFSISYRGFDLNTLFQGAGKSNFFIYGKNVYAFSEGEWGNIFSDLVRDDDRWISADLSGDPSTENPNAAYPRMSYGGNGNNYRNSTFWLRDGRYLRLKNLDIGYTIPIDFLRRIHVESVRIFFIGTNLITWAPFKVWDPELGIPRGEEYPPSKSFTAGISFSL